jgi:hypothetical protein
MWKKKIKRIKNKRNVMRANLHAKKISKNRNFYSLLCFSHQFQIFTVYKTFNSEKYGKKKILKN